MALEAIRLTKADLARTRLESHENLVGLAHSALAASTLAASTLAAAIPQKGGFVSMSPAGKAAFDAFNDKDGLGDFLANLFAPPELKPRAVLTSDDFAPRPIMVHLHLTIEGESLPQED